MFRRVSSTCRGALASPHQRRALHYTEQSDALKAAADQHGFQSNVWVPSTDAWWVAQLTPLKASAAPTSVDIRTRLELFNLDQLQKPPALPPVPDHTSFATRKPYKRKELAFELEQRRVLGGFESRYWLGAGQVKKGLRLKRGERPAVVMLPQRVSLYNAEQYEQPERVVSMPCSGGSGKRIGSATRDDLIEAVAARGFGSGLFFTKRQLERLKVPLADGVEPVVVTHVQSGMSAALYNFGDVVDFEVHAAAMAPPLDLQSAASAAAAQRFAFTGKAVWDWAVPRLSNQRLRLWVTDKEVAERGLTLGPDAEAIPLGREVAYFNVEQLQCPSDGYAAAGMLEA